MTVLLILGVLILGSCTTASFKYNNPDHIAMNLQNVSEQFLMSGMVLDEEKRVLIPGPPMRVGEFITLMMMSRTLDPEAYLTMDVKEGNETNTLILKGHKRGDVVLEITIELEYEDDFTYSVVEKVTWDNKMLGEVEELVTLEEKAGFALLAAAFLIIQ